MSETKETGLLVLICFFILFQAFPDQAQPESHQLLQYRQHGTSPKGNKEEPRCRETSEVDDQLLQVANEIGLWPCISFNICMYLMHFAKFSS